MLIVFHGENAGSFSHGFSRPGNWASVHQTNVTGQP